MGIYTNNGVCLGKDYKNSNYFYNFGNIDSVIETHEWSQGFIYYSEVKRVLNQSLENVNKTKERIENSENIDKEKINKIYNELSELIERIDKQIPEDEWYFFEITLSTYDGLNVDKVVYLPIRY